MLLSLFAELRALNAIAAGLLFLTLAQSGAGSNSEPKTEENTSCRLLGADGAPLAGVKVWQVLGGQTLTIRNSEPMPGSTLKAFTTDRDGKFEVTLEQAPGLLVALTDRGYLEAKVQGAPPAELRLRPWARIKGRAHFGTQPAVDTEMAMAFDGREIDLKAPCLEWDVQLRTNPSGEFIVEHVPAGKVSIGVRQGSGILFTEHTEVKAGETATVEFGGRGRPVVGKLAIPKEVEGKDWRARGVLIEMLPTESTRDVKRAFVTVAGDGSFRAENVESGGYQLRVSLETGSPFLTHLTRNHSKPDYAVLAEFYQYVTVPEIPGGVSDEPFDMGGVMPIHLLKVGDVAPPLECAEIGSNRRISLTDLRGKFVLLNFGARWSRQETPVLKKVWEDFKDRPDFTMVSLNCVEKIEPSRGDGANEALSWPKAHLPADKEQIMGNFGIRYLPASLLIGPDGKVVAVDLEGEAIRKAVSRALEKP